MARTKEERRTLAMTVIEAIAEGEYLREVCRRLDIPASSALEWIDSEKELAEQYARARERGSVCRAEEMEEMAAGAVGAPPEVVAAVRLQIDTRKWLLGKFAKGMFGDKVQAELTGKDGAPIETKATVDTSAVEAVLAAKFAKFSTPEG